MKTLLILLISFTSYSALACRFGDRQITHRVDSERQECTTSGYCNAYDYNSTTGRYENYYGYHSRCEGVQTRSVDTFYCEDTTETTGQPTVVLAKTVKGYGLGEVAEGRNGTHQQKKLTEPQVKYFAQRFD